MGMSTSVLLLRDKNDPSYQKKLKVLIAYQEAGLDPPKEVDDYFGGDGIDNEPESPLEIVFEPKKFSDTFSEGFEINIDELPEGVYVSVLFC